MTRMSLEYERQYRASHRLADRKAKLKWHYKNIEKAKFLSIKQRCENPKKHREQIAEQLYSNFMGWD